MPIVFAPARSQPRESGPDLAVHIRRYKGSTALELSFSAAAQDRVRYISGDRVVAKFDDQNNSWSIERVNGPGHRPGYKVTVRKLTTSGRTIASFRATCSPSDASKVLGAKERAEYEFLEVSGNVATFVGK
jgi:hypothetical protein